MHVVLPVATNAIEGLQRTSSDANDMNSRKQKLKRE